MEVERKWLVRELPPGYDALPSRPIRQGYLALEPDGREVRVRDDDGKYVLTVKSAGDVARSEDEVELSADQFAVLWPLTEGRRIEKVRAECRLTDDAVAEIDVYCAPLEPLVVAEVEFASQMAADAFTAAEWMGEEVTKDARFKNRNLAVRGLSAG